MKPLQDITNKVNTVFPNPEDELLNEIQMLSFSPTRRRRPPQQPSSSSSDDDIEEASSSPPPSPLILRGASFSQMSSRQYQRRSTRDHCSGSERKSKFPSRSPLFLKSSSCELSFEEDDDCCNLSLDSDVFFTYELENNNCHCNSSQMEMLVDQKKRNRRKRASLPACMEQSTVFKKLHPSSKNQLVDLVCDVSRITLGKTSVSCLAIGYS